MRMRLIEATIACLIDVGYANTTTTAVIQRAGVSRGAILHHFPTKADLVATAVDYAFEQRIALFRQNVSRLPRDDRFLEALLHALWSEMSSPTHHAWLELVVASRTDPDLRQRLSPLASRWTESVDATYREMFGIPRAPGKHPHALAPLVTFAVMEGLALEKIARPEDASLEKRILAGLCAIAPLGTLPALPSHLYTQAAGRMNAEDEGSRGKERTQ